MPDQSHTPAPFRITPLIFHVLLSLAEEEVHAYRIMKEVADRTDGTVKPGPGSLHFALSKLLDAEMIREADARPDPDMDDARRKYYVITPYGRAVLESELGRLADIVALARAKNLMPRGGSA